MKKAFLFSGQGAQYAGMGKELYERYACAKAVFDTADEALGFPISKMCFEEDERLHLTEFTQPAILTMSIATLKILEEHQIIPDMVCGLSLGEYTAYVASGALSFEEAVCLVKKRGKFMTEAVPAGVGSMIAIMGLDDAVVEEICSQAGDAGFVAPANYNAPGQIVIAGEKAACEKAEELAKAAGAKMTVTLNVSGPFHTALLKPASIKLEKELESVTISNMKIPVVTNVTGKLVQMEDEIKPLLVKQVMSPVRWVSCINTLTDMGADAFIEAGPGKALSGFVKRIVKGATILNVENQKTLEKTIEKIRGGQEA